MIENKNATIKNKTVLKKWYFKVLFTLFKKQILLCHNAQIYDNEGMFFLICELRWSRACLKFGAKQLLTDEKKRCESGS